MKASKKFRLSNALRQLNGLIPKLERLLRRLKHERFYEECENRDRVVGTGRIIDPACMHHD